MDLRNVGLIGRLLSIVISLIICRAKLTRLKINPAAIAVGSGFFQRLIIGINYQLGNIAEFSSHRLSSHRHTGAPSLLTANANINTNPARADVSGNNISGSELLNNFLVCLHSSCILLLCIHSHQPDVISDFSDIGYFRQGFT